MIYYFELVNNYLGDNYPRLVSNTPLNISGVPALFGTHISTIESDGKIIIPSKLLNLIGKIPEEIAYLAAEERDPSINKTKLGIIPVTNETRGYIDGILTEEEIFYGPPNSHTPRFHSGFLNEGGKISSDYLVASVGIDGFYEGNVVIIGRGCKMDVYSKRNAELINEISEHFFEKNKRKAA